MKSTIKQQPQKTVETHYSVKLGCYVSYDGENYSYYNLVDGEKVFIDPTQFRP